MQNNLRKLVRMILLENMNIPKEPPYVSYGSPGYEQAWSKWNAWFFQCQRDWLWPQLPSQKGWMREKSMGDFSPSYETDGAVLRYGSYGYQWSKRKNNDLRLLVFPDAMASDIPAGIYLTMRIRKGGARAPWAQPLAEVYFPFKKYNHTKDGMSVSALLEELSYYHDEIVECMKVLVPYGSKTIKTMQVDKFYEAVYPQLQQYATPQMTQHYQNYQRM